MNENLYIIENNIIKPSPNPIKLTIQEPSLEQYKMLGYNVEGEIKQEMPHPLKVSISNPSLEQYNLFGIYPKTLVIKEEPEYNPASQYIIPRIESETDTEIIQGWEVKEHEEIFYNE